MDIKSVLADFKKEINVLLEEYFNKAIEEARKKDVFIADALEYVKTYILSGGKRLRAALMYYGYLAAGGTEKEKMLKASMSVELVHAFLLIHDDIMDRDALRHGVDTVHYRYQKLSRLQFPNHDANHFGNSVAIIVGDMVGALGNQVLFDSRFEPDRVIQALSELQSIVALTVIGQTKDLYIEYSKKASEAEILKMYEYKTARYTMEGPLYLGGILGGASKEMLEVFSQYALPIGIAFQIQDDILGIFGSEEKIGKLVGSDIREGKMTLLVAKALECASKDHKKELEKILAKGVDVTLEDVHKFQEIVKETGSLEYAKSLANQYIAQGKEIVLQSPYISGEAREFLLAIADHMMQREY